MLTPGLPPYTLVRNRNHNLLRRRATVRSMKYPVALMPTEEGYSVSCPGLPGCWSQGATEDEALANIQDAIREYVEVAKQLAGQQNLREVEIPA